MQLMAEIDDLASRGLTDSQAHEFLAKRLGGDDPDACGETETWRILKLWLIHFFPETYQMERDHEVPVKGRELRRQKPPCPRHWPAQARSLDFQLYLRSRPCHIRS